MHLKVITPERVVFTDEIDGVSLMTTEGEITVLPHHIPLVTLLQPGELRYQKAGQTFLLAVSGGFVEIRTDGTIIILADSAEHAHEIDESRAEAARTRAQELMSTAQTDVNDEQRFVAFQTQREKALTRLQVARKYRKLK